MFIPATVRWFFLAAFFIYAAAMILPTLIHIWSLRLRAPALIRQPTLSPAHQQILAPTVRALAEAGFGWPIPVQLNNITIDYSFGYLLNRPESGTAALVTAPAIPTADVTANVSFISLFADGSVLHTIQGLGIGAVATPTDVHTEFVATRSPAATWAAHEANLERLLSRTAPSTCQPDNCLEAINERYYGRLLPNLVAQGALVAEGEPAGYYHFQWREALRQSWRFLRGRRRLRQTVRLVREEALPTNFDFDDLPIALEVEAYELNQSGRKRRASLWGRLALIFGSLALFYLSFSQLFHVRQILFLLLVLVIHEGGHLLGLKLRGYQNLSLIFVPFLGALAAGQKERETLFDRMLVIFMGPVPGLFIGLALLGYIFMVTREWLPHPPLRWLDNLWTLSNYFLILNGFNLLPFFPLDGGQIVRRTLLARAPLLDGLLRGGAVLTFVGLGLASGDTLLLFFGGLLGLATWSFFRQLGPQRRIWAAFRALPFNESEGVSTAFQAIRAAGLGPRLSFTQKRGYVSQLLEIGRDSAEGLLIRAVYLAAYGAAVALVILSLLFTAFVSRG